MKRKRNGLTAKQKKFTAARAKGLCGTAAAREAGYANPEMEGTRTGSKPVIQNEVERLLALGDVTDKRVAKVISDGLDANRAVVVSLGQGDGSKIEHVPDNPARLATAEMVLKLKGLLKTGANEERIMQTAVGIFAPLLVKLLPYAPAEVQQEVVDELETVSKVV